MASSVRTVPEVAAIESMLRASGALQEGHFLLSSGLHSAGYVQCARLLELPSRAREVGAMLAELLRELGARAVLAPAMGGLLIGHEVAAVLAVPFRFTERVGGTMALRRGFELAAGERLVIVEDVVTTGKSTMETVAIARERGATVVGVGSIIDRTGGKHPFAVPFHALHDLTFPTYGADDCPMCAAGGAPVKPGSRC